MTRLVSVVTTIQPPTPSIVALAAALEKSSAALVVVGDKKGPAQFSLPLARFYSLAEQQALDCSLAKLLPAGHYARKNLGYLIAFGMGAECIYETDDDNAPLPSWKPRDENTTAVRAAADEWINVYAAFSDDLIWPRGYPLDLVREVPEVSGEPGIFRAPIQQGLANGAPDVDAIWRLVADRPFTFDAARSVWLPPFSYCPFNSQSTWWWRDAFPLMYLPTHCSFRMTDIWRSLVAQRCLWELGQGLVFHPPEVMQARNEHDLMKDFEDEVPGYVANKRIAAMLTACKLSPVPGSAGRNLRACYEALVEGDIIPDRELPLVDAWLEDVGT